MISEAIFLAGVLVTLARDLVTIVCGIAILTSDFSAHTRWQQLGRPPRDE